MQALFKCRLDYRSAFVLSKVARFYRHLRGCLKSAWQLKFRNLDKVERKFGAQNLVPEKSICDAANILHFFDIVNSQ